MDLNDAMVKAIELTIEELKRRIDMSPVSGTAFICYSINSVLYDGKEHLEFEIIDSLKKLKAYIEEGLNGCPTLSEWIVFEMPDANFKIDDVRDNARLCWLERLVYFHEQDMKAVCDTGKDFFWSPA